MTVEWIIWSDGARTELGRCRAADKPAAEQIAAERFPGVRLLVQSAASASVAEPIPLAKPRKFYGGTRARAKAKQRRAHEQEQSAAEPMAPSQNLTGQPLRRSRETGSRAEATAGARSFGGDREVVRFAH